MKLPFPARFCLLFILVSCLHPFCAAADNVSGPHIQVRLIVDQNNIEPAADSEKPSARIGVLISIEKGWHTYWRNSGEAAIPTKVSWQLPDGWKTGDLQWPAPTRFLERGNITTYGYRDETLLWAPLYVPQIVPAPGQTVHLGARVSWLVCQEICVPGSRNVEIELPFSSDVPAAGSADYKMFEKYVALSPHLLSEVQENANLRNLTIDTASIARSSEKKQADAVIVLRNVAIGSIENVSDALQAFPYVSTGINTKPSSVNVSNSKSPGLKDLVITYPLLAQDNAPEGDVRLGGIVIFSAQLAGTTHDLSFEYQLPVHLKNGAFSTTPAATAFGVPATTNLLTYRVADNVPQPTSPATKTASGGTSTGLLQALLAAFFAGIILNLMPCVLPIISIKIMGFVSQSQESRRTIFLSSCSFAAGILSSFLLLALVLISLRSVGVSLGWGFQFQYPQFVAALLIIVFFLSLALFDFYTVNLPFMQSANKAASRVHAPMLRHFFDGVLATALSTPCTAPVLGTALVFAFAQPPYVTLLIFLTIGAGLALPYVYLSSHPKLLEKLPAPGNWMFHFRQVMGFLLLGTCAWLLSVLHDLTEKGAVWAVFLLLLLFFFLWIRKTATESKPERGRSPVFNLFFVAALLGSGWFTYPSLIKKRGSADSGLIAWVPYSAADIEQAQKKGQTIFIDFTASWCITCKFNEFRIIETQATAAAIKDNSILPMKADWTSGDEEITQALQSYGAEGVPLYVILPPDHSNAVVLSTLPSQSSLLRALAGKV
jgi:thiol:disulfide interchange protein DsbD